MGGGFCFWQKNIISYCFSVSPAIYSSAGFFSIIIKTETEASKSPAAAENMQDFINFFVHEFLGPELSELLLGLIATAFYLTFVISFAVVVSGLFIRAQ